MSYLEYMIRIARQLNSLVVIEKDEEKFLFIVYIHNVRLKEKYVPIKIKGKGFTIEDAAFDFVRLARGGHLVHDINNKKVEVL